MSALARHFNRSDGDGICHQPEAGGDIHYRPAVLAVLIVVIMRRAFPQFRTLQEKLDALNSCIQEGLVGIRLIKSFVRGDYEEMRFEKRNQQLKEANLTAMKTMLLYTPLMTLALNITTVVVVWSGGNMIVAGNMQVAI